MGFVAGGVFVDVVLGWVWQGDAEVVDCGLRVVVEVFVDADSVVEFERGEGAEVALEEVGEVGEGEFFLVEELGEYTGQYMSHGHSKLLRV